MEDQASDLLLTRREVAEKFGIPHRFLETHANSKDGPPIVRIGGLVRYRAEDVRSWIEANVHGG